MNFDRFQPGDCETDWLNGGPSETPDSPCEVDQFPDPSIHSVGESANGPVRQDRPNNDLSGETPRSPCPTTPDAAQFETLDGDDGHKFVQKMHQVGGRTATRPPLYGPLCPKCNHRLEWNWATNKWTCGCQLAGMVFGEK